MKNILFLLPILLSIFSSCSDSDEKQEIAEEIEIANDILINGLYVGSEKCEKSIDFSTNTNWTLTIKDKVTKNDPEWCKASITKGESGAYVIKLAVETNDSYSNREALVTINAGKTNAKFIITQKQKDALILTSNRFELSSDECQINVEVKANIDYDIFISEADRNWISTGRSARELSKSNLVFSISKSEEYNTREGEIVIKSKEISETIHIIQKGNAILLVDEEEYAIDKYGGNLSIKVKSNSNIRKETDASWINETTTRSLSENLLTYNITPNEQDEFRIGHIYIYDIDKRSNQTIRIVQAPNNSKKTISIVVEKAGSLSTLLDVSAKENISMLTISGNMNGSDIKYLRSFLSPSRIWDSYLYLNMAHANIVSGGSYYYSEYFNGTRYTQDNELGKYFFYDCNAIKHLVLPYSLLTIEEEAISCLNVETISIKKNVNNINDRAFGAHGNQWVATVPYQPLKKLKSIEVSSSNPYYTVVDGVLFTKNIDKLMLYPHILGSEYTIPTTVKEINPYSFAYSKINHIEFPSSIERIGTCAFDSTPITNLVFHNNIKNIEYGVFRNCNLLTTITFHSDPSLGYIAFGFCPLLTEIHCLQKVPSYISKDAFDKTTLDKAVLYVPKGSYDLYSQTSGWRNFTNIREE